MKHAIATSLAVFGLLALGTGTVYAADAEARCEPMKEAGARIVMAREAFYPEDAVVQSAVEDAESEAVADLLRESIADIYADMDMWEDGAGEMMFERCVALARSS